MITLLLSLAALLGAPLLDRLLVGRPGFCAALDAAGKVLVGGIVLITVLPYGYQQLGWPALVALAAGALLPVGCGRLPGGEGVVGAAAGLALVSHGLLDGAMLAEPEASEAAHGLAHAVVLHSLPVGLMLWRGLQPAFGPRVAWGALGVSALCEALGWVAGPAVLAPLGPAVGLVQCLAAGSLLHVLGHVGGGPARSEGIGALVGLLGLAALTASHAGEAIHPDHLSLARAILGLAWTCAPGLGLALILAAGARTLGWVGAERAIILAGLALAGLGPEAAVLVLGTSLLLAIATVALAPQATSAPRVSARAALRVVVDEVAPWVSVGVLLAALLEALLPTAALSGPMALDAWLGRPGMWAYGLALLVGLPLVTGTYALVPLAVVAVHKGLDPGVALLALVAGAPRRGGRGGRGLALRLGAAALVYGVTANGKLLGAVPDLHALLTARPGPLALGAVAGLAALLVGSLLRQGLTDFLDPLLHPGGLATVDPVAARVHAHEHAGEHAHTHEHMHEHTHDHGHGPP